MGIEGESEGLASQDVDFEQKNHNNAETESETGEVDQALRQVTELYDDAYQRFDHAELRDSYLLSQGKGPGFTAEEMRSIRGSVDHFAMLRKQVEAIQARMARTPGPLEPQERELLNSVAKYRESTLIPGKPN